MSLLERFVRTPTPGDQQAPHPTHCVWEITLACDLACRHCGSRAGKARPNELSTEACLEVVQELAQLGVREVTLIGGEFYMRDDWDVIARAITRAGMVPNMVTGARNLTSKRIRRAYRAGVRSISISIDGLEAAHTAQRGFKGSFAAATDAARRVARSRIQLCVNTQINRHSIDDLEGLAQHLVEMGAKAWQIQLTVAMGRAADRPELLLQPYELLTLFPRLVALKQDILTPGGVELFPGNNIGYFGPYERFLRYGGEEGAYWTGCAAGKWVLGLEADGSIKGCPSLPTSDYRGGLLGRDALADVVAHAPELRALRERSVDDLWGFCHSCYYASVCQGGCSWTTHVLFGRPGNNPYCIYRALELEKRGLRERVVQTQRAPGQPFDHGLFEIQVESTP